MTALILAAGYATRLYPLTRKYPKSLLRVKNKPVIDYIVAKLKKLPGLKEIIVVTNSKFFARFKRWAGNRRGSGRVTIIDDQTRDNADRLGAVGDMGFVLSIAGLRDDLLVIGGDNLFDGDLKGFVRFARSKHPDPVTGAFDIGDIGEARNYGVMKVNRAARLVSFREKPKAPKSTLVGMCLYYFPASTLGLVREYLSSGGKSDAMGSYISWLHKRRAVYVYEFKGRWFDIGDHEFYSRAKRQFN